MTLHQHFPFSPHSPGLCEQNPLRLCDCQCGTRKLSDFSLQAVVGYICLTSRYPRPGLSKHTLTRAGAFLSKRDCRRLPSSPVADRTNKALACC